MRCGIYGGDGVTIDVNSSGTGGDHFGTVRRLIEKTQPEQRSRDGGDDTITYQYIIYEQPCPQEESMASSFSWANERRG